MLRAALVSALLTTTLPALALPVNAIGKWSLEKGKCGQLDEELIVRITPKAVDHYEDVCKITKEEPSANADTYYKLTTKCDSEGTKYKKVMYIYSPSAPDQLPVMLGVDGLGQRTLYRCKK